MTEEFNQKNNRDSQPELNYQGSQTESCYPGFQTETNYQSSQTESGYRNFQTGAGNPYSAGQNFANQGVPGSNNYTGQPHIETEVQNASPELSSTPKRSRKKSGKRNQVAAVIALATCCSLLGGLVGAGGMALGTGILSSNRQENNTTVTGSTLNIADNSTDAKITTVKKQTGEMTASEIYEKNVSSTVGITTSTTVNYFGYRTNAAAAGSGFILTDDGYIVTNYHVIEGANAIKVTAYDGTEYDAKVVGYDDSNDLAVLKVDATGLTPVILGDSDSMSVGEDVIAIGNPLGELTFSLTSGAISAINREITIDNKPMNLIQTDCAINSGNSGGALFNMRGEVIGITNAKYSGNGSERAASVDNIGFAIPINSVRSAIESIIDKGYLTKSYIGVTIGDIASEYQNLGLPKGAVIVSVEDGGPAAKAGLAANDIVTEINGEEISGSSELKRIVSSTPAGEKLKLTIYRQGQILNLEVEVSEKQQSATGNTTTDNPSVENSSPENGSPENGSPQNNPMGNEFFGNYGDFPEGFGFFQR